MFSQNKKVEPRQPPDLTGWLEKISNQLERLILCQEKRLSGEVLKDFNSKQFLEKEVKNA